jgi:hypothetical protein
MFDDKTRHLQIVYNRGIDKVNSFLPIIPLKHIIIKGSTPYIKREGIRSRRQDIQEIRVSTW